jgi:hypothetical protein
MKGPLDARSDRKALADTDYFIARTNVMAVDRTEVGTRIRVLDGSVLRGAHRGLLIVALLASTACAGGKQAAMDPQQPCQSGEVCTVEGRLTSADPWVTQLEAQAGCHAMAVPASFASVASKFDGRRVRVTGKAYSQPVSAPQAERSYYEVRGMRVNMNLCDLALVVFSIEASDGEKWVNKDQAPDEP